MSEKLRYMHMPLHKDVFNISVTLLVQSVPIQVVSSEFNLTSIFSLSNYLFIHSALDNRLKVKVNIPYV
jgi:hypothetical protein